ncbi:MAG: ABC transporter ATP-binding protein [Chloroflexi bacterium]|nr:ABC transporter ATP-binding protein [Chloroflexota bacterium]
MIVASALTKQFGPLTAVDGLTFEVNPGETLALLGPNGAGKTTTVRMLSGLLRPTAGQASIAGYDTVQEAARVHAVVGLLTEQPGFYPRMDPLAYLLFFGQLYGLSPRAIQQRSEELLTRFGLWEHRHTAIGAFSAGMRQRMALMRALIHNPAVLFLDEPTSALDPSNAKIVRDYIAELKRGGHTIIVCTHNLAEAELLADSVAIIRSGRLLKWGPLARVKDELLGPPTFEVRLCPAAGAALDEAVPGLRRLVQVENTGPDWLRFRTESPTATNPLVVRSLVEAGHQVVSLAEVPRSLEDVYLKLVAA